MAEKTYEVQGIEVCIDEDALSDWEVAENMVIVMDEGSSDEERTGAVVRVMRFVLGKRYASIKRELRERGEGRLTAEAMMEFLRELFESIGAAKN